MHTHLGTVESSFVLVGGGRQIRRNVTVACRQIVDSSSAIMDEQRDDNNTTESARVDKDNACTITGALGNIEYAEKSRASNNRQKA